MENLTQKFDLFKIAAKSKGLHSVQIVRRDNETFMVLVVRERNKYTKELETFYTKYPISLFSYIGYTSDKPIEAKDIEKIFFTQFVGVGECHIKTILKHIKHSSNIVLKVVGFDNNNVLDNFNMVQHHCFLIIDNNTFLFSTYVGLDNSASPINY